MGCQAEPADLLNRDIGFQRFAWCNGHQDVAADFLDVKNGVECLLGSSANKIHNSGTSSAPGYQGSWTVKARTKIT